MKNIFLIVALEIALAATALAQSADDPFGRYDKTLTVNIGKLIPDPNFKYPQGDDPENNIYSRYILEKLNIDVKNAWQAGNQKDYDQKVNLAIAANDLPDALVVSNQQLRSMAKANQLADLSAAFQRYASPVVQGMYNKTEGQAAKAVTFGRKMLAVPAITIPDDAYHLTWIRKDWLDKLGLKPPKTLNDLEAVARAFVEKDPGGNGKGNTIGIGGPQNGGSLYCTFIRSTNNAFGFDPIFGAFHSYPGFWLKDAKGKAVYGSILPETKAALAKLADWYAKGLIDQEMGVRKDASEPVVSGKTGIFCGPWWLGYWPLPDAIKNNPKANWHSYAIPVDANGAYTPHGGTNSNSFTVVRQGFSNPEAIVKMDNLLVRDQGGFDESKAWSADYPLFLPMAYVDEMPVTLNALKAVLAGKKKPADFDTPEFSGYKLLKSDVSVIREVKRNPVDNMDIQYWNTADSNWPRMYSVMVGTAPLYEKPFAKTYSLIWSQTKTMESKWATLKKLEDETFLKIIMGVAPLSSFDAFVKAWKAQGGDQITAEVQAESQS